MIQSLLTAVYVIVALIASPKARLIVWYHFRPPVRLSATDRSLAVGYTIRNTYGAGGGGGSYGKTMMICIGAGGCASSNSTFNVNGAGGSGVLGGRTAGCT